jgi:hypothetical protein
MTDPSQVSDKVRVVALPVAFLLGVFGAHRFYVGKIGTGLLMAGTLGGCGLWWLYDLILIVAGEFRDSDGRRVTRWTSSDPFPELPEGAGRSDALLAEVDSLRTEMGELAERVDFMERLLTQARERGALPPR